VIRISLMVGSMLLLVAVIFSTFAIVANPRSSTSDEQPGAAAPLTIAQRIPADQVATSIRLSQVESVAGALRAGDPIDVYGFYPERLTGDVAATRTLLRQKLIYTTTQDPEGQSVTLAMPPQEALLLEEALRMGARPYAVLRSRSGMSGASDAPNVLDTNALAAMVGSQ
jgi:hypothetical protein